MLSSLVRILAIIASLWIIRRFLGSFLGETKANRDAGRRREREQKPAGPEQKMVRDPVCGMYMDPRLAIRVENGSGTHYFCSDECRRKFVA